MFILKFFASIFLIFFFIGLLFIVMSFLVAQNFLKDLNSSLKDKFDKDGQGSTFSNETDIPSAIECPLCGTFYAKMPESGRCSCGANLK